MKNTSLWLSLALSAVGLVACWNAPVVLAAEEQKEPQVVRQEASMAAQPTPCGMMCCRQMMGCKYWGSHRRSGFGCVIGVVLLVLLICNILLAGWIYTDIRKQGQGHGVFVALALLAGFPTAIVYALIRIGDKKS